MEHTPGGARAYAAVDLGATSGRVMVGRVERDRVTLAEVARFANSPVATIDGLHWDVLGLYRSMLDGLAAAHREHGLASIGIDSWAVDYALMRDGRMLATPYSYRDPRTSAAVEAVTAIVPPAELYAANGLQHLPFTTLFQLAADRASGLLELADGILLLPDLLAYWLTGVAVAERSNASTTGLLGVHDREWDAALAERVDVPVHLLPPLVDAGTALGPLHAVAADEMGIAPPDGPVVTAVGSHDTASAVVAVPATEPGFGYVSCGTWSLVGVELEHPVLSEESRLAGFTNEAGVDGRVRYLHNVMGLWLLSESVRTWERAGERVDLDALLAAAARVEGPVSRFDADDEVFLPPGDMPARIARWLRERDLPVPETRAALVRSILESLAHAYARTLRAAERLSGERVRVVHIVGGGSRNELLCRLTAEATGLPVVAGPVEATALGNVLVQARAHGDVGGDLETLRALVARSTPVRTYPAAAPAL